MIKAAYATLEMLLFKIERSGCPLNPYVSHGGRIVRIFLRVALVAVPGFDAHRTYSTRKSVCVLCRRRRRRVKELWIRGIGDQAEATTVVGRIGRVPR